VGTVIILLKGIQKLKEIFWKELFLEILVYHSQYVLRLSFQDCNDFFFTRFLQGDVNLFLNRYPLGVDGGSSKD
jgi:hypothetical protein